MKERPVMRRRPKQNRRAKRRDPRDHGKSAADPTPRRRNAWTVPALGGLLLLAVGLVFGQTLRHAFVNYDDTVYAYENPHIRAGLTAEGVFWAFSHSHAANWHPLSSLSHMLDCQLYGLNPGLHHLNNVLLHAGAAILLLLVLWRMTDALWPSALVAALFAIHPLRVESVAWVSERKDVLSGLFFMLTLAAYVAYARRPTFSLTRYLAVIALFALGLMAKPVLVTLPFLLLLLDYWPLGRWGTGPFFGGKTSLANKRLSENMDLSPSAPHDITAGAAKIGTVPWRLIVEKVPLLVLTVASCVTTIVAQGRAVIALDTAPLGSRIANAVVAYAAYLGQFFWPRGLAVFYPHPRDSLLLGQVAGASLLLIGITAAAVGWRRRYPYLLVGWLWYLGMLVPMIGLVQVGRHAMADRYTYLPAIGLCLALVFGAAQVVAARPGWRRPAAMAAVGLLAAWMGCAWQQTTSWRNSETLWTRALACTHNNSFAYGNLGLALLESGRRDDGIAQLQKSLEINPGYAKAQYNLGLALAAAGRTEEAIVHYQKAIALRPDYVDPHVNLGALLQQRGELAEAIAHYRRALAIDPDCAVAHSNLGLALYQRGATPEAIVQLREALRLRPRDLAALNQLAWILATSPDSAVRNGAAAVVLAQRAAELSGVREPSVLGTLAAAYAENGRFQQAAATAERAIAVATDHGDTALAELYRSQQKLYQAGLPFHEPPRQPRP
jgi:protein O-mannosyl-transferase